jgi:hypothetical protein
MPIHGGDQDVTWVHVDDLDPLLAREKPQTDANGAAADLLKLALQIRRERSWSRSERSKALIALCQKVRYSERAHTAGYASWAPSVPSYHP